MQTTVLTNAWKVDTNHSTIGFRIKHLGIAEITGSFAEFEGSVKLSGDDFSGAKIQLLIHTDSITTGNAMRDNHLKTEEFLDASTFPDITFESTAFTRKDAQRYNLSGILTIKNIAKPVELVVDELGITKDMWGNEIAVFKVHGSFNRRDFNVQWYNLLDNGLAVVGDEIRLDINVELIHDA